MLEMWSLYLSVLSASLSVLCAWPEFVNKIPNGRSVPNPCGSEPKLWRVVGHQYATRSLFSTAKKRALTDPFLNVFGQMYRDNNYRWSDICDLDADGDGKSNGQELGDPDCVWKRGQEPAGPATGHPGICEDANNQVCADHPTASYCSASLPSLMAANVNVNSQGEIPPPPVGQQGEIPPQPGNLEGENPPPSGDQLGELPPPMGQQEELPAPMGQQEELPPPMGQQGELSPPMGQQEELPPPMGQQGELPPPPGDKPGEIIPPPEDQQAEIPSPLGDQEGEIPLPPREIPSPMDQPGELQPPPGDQQGEILLPPEDQQAGIPPPPGEVPPPEVQLGDLPPPPAPL